jgi:phage protein D
MVASQFRPARPTITLGGRDSAVLTQQLVRLRVHEDQAGLSSCEATFENWGTVSGRLGFLYLGRDQLDFGKRLGVKLDQNTVFAGRITALEGTFPDGAPPELTVLAEDAFQDLRMTRRSRTFLRQSDAEVIRTIAGEHGLTADVDVAGSAHPVLAQLNQSDLAFIRERARACDAEVWLEDKTLRVVTHSTRRGAGATYRYGNELTRFTVLADLAGQRSSVTVTGWDVAAKKALAEKADDQALGAELDDGQSGASVLGTALATRKETVARTAPLSSGEARARAEALFRRDARRFVRGRGRVAADGTCRVGAGLRLEGLGPLFSGRYYVTDCTSTFDSQQGFQADFTVERPALGRPR